MICLCRLSEFSAKQLVSVPSSLVRLGFSFPVRWMKVWMTHTQGRMSQLQPAEVVLLLHTLSKLHRSDGRNRPTVDFMVCLMDRCK